MTAERQTGMRAHLLNEELKAAIHEGFIEFEKAENIFISAYVHF